MIQQKLLFDAVIDTYVQADGSVNNQDLYSAVAERLNLKSEQVEETKVCEKSGGKYNLFYRKVRWVQQSLKSKKLLTSVGRSEWEIHKEKKQDLTAITAEKNVISVSTDLGIVVWTKNRKLFSDMIDEPFHAMITSPPYPLKNKRAYGNPDVDTYVDFICESLEPIIPKLVTGGSIVLNVSNDIFMSKSPARSTYWMKLTIALEERLGLHFMDNPIWSSNKIPGPTHWACTKHRIQLKHGYEHCLWFTNSPIDCFADNRRVLKPNTNKHNKFIQDGGMKTKQVNGDGAYIKNVGDFSSQTKGTIPYNVLQLGNRCEEARKVKTFAKEQGLIEHGATMPLTLAEFFVKFLTRPGDLVVDLFGGTLTLGQAAQNHQRRWICLEMMLEYVAQGFVRFKNCKSAWFNPNLLNVPCLNNVQLP